MTHKEAVLPYNPKIEKKIDLVRLRDDWRIFGGWYATLKTKGKFKYSKNEILEKFLVPCLKALIAEGSTEFHAKDWKKLPREIYLEAFDKVVTKFRYLVGSHGKLIWSGLKTATVHARKFIQGSFFSIVDPNLEFGFARFEQGKKISLEEFSAKYKEHRITEDERKEWWPDKTSLYFYKLRTWIPLEQPRTVKVPKGIQTYGNRQDLKESTHKRNECMECKKTPEYEVLWAEGIGHAWFCENDFKKWAIEGDGRGDICAVKEIRNGEAAKKFGDNRNPNIKDKLEWIKESEETHGLDDFEYLLHHIHKSNGGKEEIHHCFMLDHMANMFVQEHLAVEDGKTFLNGRVIKDGVFHIIQGLEKTQEVVWSNQEAQENKITPKRVKAGMTLKEKAKEW